MNRYTTLLLLIPLLCQACKTRFHDHPGRLVTVERWSSAYGYGRAWAAYSDRVVVFTVNDFNRPEHVVAKYTLDEAWRARIEAAIQRIPAETKGKHYHKDQVHDGTMFRVSFSPSGELRSDRVEVENVALADLVPLMNELDTHLAPAHQIQYQYRTTLTFGDRLTNLKTIITDLSKE